MGLSPPWGRDACCLSLCFSVWHRVRQRKNMAGLGFSGTVCLGADGGWSGEGRDRSWRRLCGGPRGGGESKLGWQSGLREPGTQSRDLRKGREEIGGQLAKVMRKKKRTAKMSAVSRGRHILEESKRPFCCSSFPSSL